MALGALENENDFDSRFGAAPGPRHHLHAFRDMPEPEDAT